MTPLFLAVTVGATWTLSVQRTEAAASCPDETRLRRAIAERLGRDPFVPASQAAPGQRPVSPSRLAEPGGPNQNVPQLDPYDGPNPNEQQDNPFDGPNPNAPQRNPYEDPNPNAPQRNPYEDPNPNAPQRNPYEGPNPNAPQRNPYEDPNPNAPQRNPYDDGPNPVTSGTRTPAKPLPRTPARPSTSAEEHRTLSVQFSRDSSRHLATVSLLDRFGRRTGTRELSSTASDCAELAGAVVLAATIVIDPMVLSRPAPVIVDAGIGDGWALPPLSAPPDAMRPPPVQPRQEPPLVELPPLPRPPPEPVRPLVVAPPPPPKPLDALFLGLGGGLSIGQVPEVAALGTLQASWGTRNTLLSLSADLTSPGTRPVGVGSIAALLFSGALDACAKWWWLGGCLAASVGTWQSWSSNLPNPRPQGTLFVSAGLGALLDLPAGELVRVRVGAKGWYQPNVIVDVGNVPVWASGHFAFTATVSAHFKLWGDVLP